MKNSQTKRFKFCRDHSVAHESVCTKTKSKSIAKTTVNSGQFTQMYTAGLIQKLCVFANEADLDTKTLPQERINNTVRKGIRSSDSRPQKRLEINQSKAVLSQNNKFEQRFVQEGCNILCHEDPKQNTCKTEKITNY